MVRVALAALIVALTASASPASTARSHCARDVFYSDRTPSWSADGKAIAFVRRFAEGGSRIYAVSPEGENLRPLTGCLPVEFDSELHWSLRSTELALSSSGAFDPGRIWIVAADGSGVISQTTGHAARWAPDGAQLVFERGGRILIRAAHGGAD